MPFSIRPLRRLPLAYWSSFLSVIILLLLSSGPAYAEWVLYGTTNEGMHTIYVDPDTIRRKGDLVKMWVLTDFTTAVTVEGSGILSVKTQEEYDCQEERKRTLASTFFSGHMGSRTVNYSNVDEGKWAPVAPDSVTQGLWKLACAKK